MSCTVRLLEIGGWAALLWHTLAKQGWGGCGGSLELTISLTGRDTFVSVSNKAWWRSVDCVFCLVLENSPKPLMDQPFSVPVSYIGDFELTDWNHITGLWRFNCTAQPLYCCHQLVWVTTAWDIHCLPSGVLLCCTMEMVCQIKHRLSVVTRK